MMVSDRHTKKDDNDESLQLFYHKKKRKSTIFIKTRKKSEKCPDNVILHIDSIKKTNKKLYFSSQTEKKTPRLFVFIAKLRLESGVDFFNYRLYTIPTL